MNVEKFACGFLVLSAFLGTARADFVLSYTAEQDAPAPGLNRYEFFARNDGQHGSGVRLLDLDVELVTNQPMVIGNFPHSSKPDLTGSRTPDPYHSDRSFVNILGDPASDDTAPDNFWVVEARVVSQTPSGGITDFDVSGPHLENHGVIATDAANGGRGALFAVAVVPSSTSLIKLIPWGFGGETGPAFGDYRDSTSIPPLQPGLDDFRQLNPLSVPEPSVLCIAGGMVLLIPRRSLR
jgi:hypothetical protein